MPIATEEPREFSLQKTERIYVKIWVGVVISLCLFVALCWGGRRGYVRWQERTLMRQAHAAFDKNDLRWAALAAQRAWSFDPDSADACRVLADIAQKQNSPEAIEWRRRAVSSSPDSISEKIALANTALRFSQTGVADDALGKVPLSQQNDPDFQTTAAHVALAENDLSAAGEHLRAAARLAPNDAHRQIELAEFQLRSNDRTQRQQGADLASRLKNDPAVRIDAMHILLSDALRRGYDSESISLAKELEGRADAPASDRLLALEILRNYHDPDFAATLTRLENAAAKNPDDAARLVTWLNAHGLALLAIDWSRQLSADILDHLAVRFGLADSFVQMRDWKALQHLLGRGGWGDAESLRLTFAAKAAHETGEEKAFEKNWQASVDAAAGNKDRLKILESLAFQWHWPEKAVAILWTLADNTQTRDEALRALYNYYAAQRDTLGLYRTLARLVEAMPNDLTVKNNFAQISLLLNAEPQRAQTAAREVHTEQPQNAAFTSTFAFGLYHAGDVPGALRAMEALPPAELNEPSVAAYYGVILAAAGRKADAARFLNLAEKAKLLPEEERLVVEARDIVAPRAPYHGTLAPNEPAVPGSR